MDGQLATEDIIPNAQSLIVFSARGFIKRMPADTFSVQASASAIEIAHLHAAVVQLTWAVIWLAPCIMSAACVMSHAQDPHLVLSSPAPPAVGKPCMLQIAEHSTDLVDSLLLLASHASCTYAQHSSWASRRCFLSAESWRNRQDGHAAEGR